MSEKNASHRTPTLAADRFSGLSRHLFDHLPLAIVVTSPAGKIIDANQAAQDSLLLDVNPDLTDSIHRPTRALVRRDGTAMPKAEHPSELARLHGTTIVLEQIGLVGTDGETTWFEVTSTPVPGLGVITTYHDVTRGHQVESDLRHHLDQLDAFFDTNLDLLVILNADGRAVRLNPAWAKLLGYESGELDGAKLLDFVHPSDSEATLGALSRMRSRSEVVGFVNRMHHADGGYRILEWRATARDALIYATSRDITDQRLAETALRESEARFRAIFEQAAVGVAEVEAGTGRFLRVNRRLCEIVGYTQEELQGLTFQAITHPEEMDLDAEDFKRLMAGEIRESQRDKRYVRKDGLTVWASRQVRLVGELGEPAHRMVTVVEDITERRETDELLRKSLADALRANQRLDFQVARMPLALIAWDQDFRVSEWNPAAERIFGWPANEAIGKHAYELLVPLDVRPVVAGLWQAVVEGADFGSHSINDNITRDGRRITCEWFNTQQIDPNGKIIGCLSMTHDITERLRLEEKVIRSQHMESLGSFAGGVAHDIGNLIRTILGVATSIHKSVLSTSPLAHDVGTIIKACTRGRTLVRGLLDFARQDLADSKPIDLRSLLDDQLDLLGRTIPPGVQVLREFDPGLCPVTGDEPTLGSAIMHLIINALDAMPRGGLLTLRARMRSDDRIQIDVEDTGTGMSKDVLEHAMEPFFSTKSRDKGAGLGLPAVYGAVKAHHGHMEIQSEVGLGTQIHITLPKSIKGGERLNETGELVAIPESSGLNILLVDDDDLVVTAVSAQLRRLGHSVIVAENGQAAIDRLMEGAAVDLVVLDINMPVLDGCQALPRLRQLRPQLPVIIETGDMGDKAEDLARAYENVSILVRPFSLNEIKATLAPWVERANAPKSTQ
jgi:PAS domain S-box-containing protein